MSQSQVVDIRKGSNDLSVRLENGRTIRIHPFAYVKAGERLEIHGRDEVPTSVWKLPTGVARKTRDRLPVWPPYAATATIDLPPHRLRLIFREKISERDWAVAKGLEQFHYRGKGSDKLIGRRVVLLAELEGRGIVGYGVLASALPAAAPRFHLLGTNFGDQMKSGLVNKIARIPRVVVHPEFRGIGIGSLLVKHLVRFAKKRWNVNGVRPILVEAIASMSDFHGFFQAAGFIPIGRTKGYAEALTPLFEGKGKWVDRPNSHHYDYLKNQRSKPYLVYPLTKALSARVLAQAREQERIPPPGLLSPRRRVLASLARVTCSVRTRRASTHRSREVGEAFGLGPEVSVPMFRDLSMKVYDRDVVLIEGASGAGKSVLVDLIKRDTLDFAPLIQVRGRVKNLDSRTTSGLSLEFRSVPLVDQVGSSTKEAIWLLNRLGLAEAHLYMRRPKQLSHGQLYRFAVAKLVDSGRRVWLADEFASSLDPITAAIVAKGLREVATRLGATMVIASADPSRYVGCLKPNQIVSLNWGQKPKVRGLRLFLRAKSRAWAVTVENAGNSTLTNIRIGHLDSTRGETVAFSVPRLPVHGYVTRTVRRNTIGNPRVFFAKADGDLTDVLSLDGLR